jgi:hypothetical protein
LLGSILVTTNFDLLLGNLGSSPQEESTTANNKLAKARVKRLIENFCFIFTFVLS